MNSGRKVAVTEVKVARHDSLSLVEDECGPRQRADGLSGSAFNVRRPVLCDGAGRDSNVESGAQDVGDLLLADAWIIFDDVLDEFLEILRDGWSPALAGLPTPQKAEPEAMPAVEGGWFQDEGLPDVVEP